MPDFPPLQGLVLAGGQSRRMGRDKGLLRSRGKEWRLLQFERVQKHLPETYLSLRSDQLEGLTPEIPTIMDQLEDCGPISGLISAFRQFPYCAWLAVAVDMPGLTEQSLKFLINNRDAEKMATAFVHKEHGFPEPLCTIWEPAMKEVLEAAWEVGEFSLNKILSAQPVKLLKSPFPEEMNNINSPEDLKSWEG